MFQCITFNSLIKMTPYSFKCSSSSRYIFTYNMKSESKRVTFRPVSVTPSTPLHRESGVEFPLDGISHVDHYPKRNLRRLKMVSFQHEKDLSRVGYLLVV